MADPIRPPSSVLRPQSAVDADNPWPGLASFTEETRAFFHGRDQEVTELFRRVQRKHLTILFGQSGHGKSSLLRAGLVPKLRPEGYCPIYIRLDHTPGSLPLSEQIKERVFRATAEAGTWTKPGASVAGESLWEFLHHRDDQLKEASGRTLVPLIIFDQFEEIFTLAQTDATGRARAEAFITDLADLVENRPPLELEEKLEQDPAGADRFDFDRADYRILITLREDYLPHLEALKKRMPSITQNRLRLSRLSGKQAHESVLKTGGGGGKADGLSPSKALVTPEVAEAIVKFVSGAEDLAHAQVEPSLLSLVCRELNETRRARGHDTITADLLEGSRESILSEYYERTLTDVPTKVREFIEDELLTSSGFRESVGEERVLKALAESGAAPDTLAKLVNDRLLRIEERLDVRRVEITHDVLCSIVKTSREKRRERLAIRRARRLRWMVTGLAAGLIALISALAVGNVRSRRLALEAAQRSSRSDFTFGSQALEQGKVSEGLAYLARAARSDPFNVAAGPRIISALTSRPFTVPVGLGYAHDTSVAILGLSSDSSHMVTLTGQGVGEESALHFWDTVKGTRVVPPVVLESGMSAYAVDPSGARLAVALNNGTAGVWEIATGRRLIGPLTVGSNPICVTFSPDGEWLASGTQNTGTVSANVKLWDARTGELRATLPMRDGESRGQIRGWVSSLSFSPDSTRLLATDFWLMWRVWSVPTGEVLRSGNPTDVVGQANSGQFSPDGRLIVLTDMTGAQMWDWATGTKVGLRMVHSSRSDTAEFSRDGALLWTSSSDRTTKVWKVPSGQLVTRLEIGDNTNDSQSKRLSRDGKRLLTVDSRTGAVFLQDTATGRSLIEPLRTSVFRTALFSPDEKEIWTSDRDGMVRRWRAEASATLPLELTFGPRSGGAIGFTESGDLMLRFNDRIETRNVVTGAIREQTPPWAIRYGSVVRSADSRFAAVINTEGQAELLDYRQPGTIARTPLAPLSRTILSTAPVGNTASPSPFKFSNDGTRLAQISADSGRFWIWETATGKQLGEFEAKGIRVSPSAARLDFDPAGERFLIGDTAGAVGVFDIARGNLVGEMMQQQVQINSVAFSPDGRRVASTGNSGQVWLTEADTGRNVLPPLKLPSAGNGLRFSNDGRFVSVRSARQLVIWDTRTGTSRSLALDDGNLAFPEGLGRFDPTSGRVMLNDLDANVFRLYSLATGQMLADPIRPAGPPTAASSFSPDGQYLGARLDGRPTFNVWPVVPLVTDTAVPAWVPRLASAVAGGVINEAGEFQSAQSDPGEFAALKAELAALTEDAPYVRWGRWFLEDPATRPINPFSTLSRNEAARLADSDPLAVAKATENRLRAQSNWVEAELAGREILARLRERGGFDDETVSDQLAGLAQSLNGQSRFPEAETLARESLALMQRLAVTDPERMVAARLEIGVALAGQRRFAEAEPMLQSAFDAYGVTQGLVPETMRRVGAAMAALLRNTSRAAEAEVWDVRANGFIDYGR